MGKPSGRKNRVRKKFNYDRNRKKEWKKLTKLPRIKCDPIRKEWAGGASIKSNLRRMGLVSDTNKAFKIPTTKELFMQNKGTQSKKTFKPTKIHVLNELEMMAVDNSEPNFRVSEKTVQFASYMMEKYGEDYKAMARDIKNYYQYTPKHIKNLIKKFQKSTAQYNAYLSVKNSVSIN